MTLEKIIEDKYNDLSSELNLLTDESDKFDMTFTVSPIEDVVEMISARNKFSAIYQVLGTYDHSRQLFSWASGYGLLNKDKTTSSKAVRNYAKTLHDGITNRTYSDVEYAERLYYYISNSIFTIGEDNLDDIVKIATFVTEACGVIYHRSDTVGPSVFYIILDIVSR